MMEKRSGRNVWIITCLFFFLCLLFCFSSSLYAQPSKHIVQKGDTLWGICEKYYGDPNLWPKLWEMNPFVTNPHLLLPGDVITLLEEDVVKKAEPPKKATAEVAKASPVIRGIDLSDRINLESLGYFSRIEVQPLGAIESSGSTKMILTMGDKAFVNFGDKRDIKPGEIFTIAQRSELIRHPLTNKPHGYLVSVRGTLTVKEYLQKGIYLTEVGKTFAEVFVGDIVIPHQRITPCLQPTPTDPKFYGNIIAVEGNKKVIGRGSIVYLDSGFKDGVQTGCVFDLVRLYQLPTVDPQHDSFGEMSRVIREALFKEQYLADFWRKIQEGKTLYEFFVGKLIVLDSRPDTSVAVVLHSTEELMVGAFVKGMSWAEPPEIIASLPSCAIK